MQFGKVTSHESFSRKKGVFRKVPFKLILNTLRFVSTRIVSDVEIDVGLGNGKVRIWVKDDGIGMDGFYGQQVFKFSKASAKAASSGSNFWKVLKSNEPR